MGTVIKITGSNFDGKGLPSIYPFISIDSLIFGYDFYKRNMSEEKTNSNAATFSTPLKGQSVGSAIYPKISNDLMGVDINESCIDLNLVPYTLKTDGTTPVSIMIVGCRNGESLNSGQSASPYLSPIINWGNDFGNGAGFMVQFSSTGKMGVRYNNTDEGNLKVNDNGNKPALYFVTYDGKSIWTIQNMTNAITSSSTSSASDMKAVSTANPIQVGTKRVNDATYLLPFNIYQVAAWNKVLSSKEMIDQYNLSRKNITGFNI